MEHCIDDFFCNPSCLCFCSCTNEESSASQACAGRACMHGFLTKLRQDQSTLGLCKHQPLCVHSLRGFVLAAYAVWYVLIWSDGCVDAWSRAVSSKVGQNANPHTWLAGLFGVCTRNLKRVDTLAGRVLKTAELQPLKQMPWVLGPQWSYNKFPKLDGKLRIYTSHCSFDVVCLSKQSVRLKVLGLCMQ